MGSLKAAVLCGGVGSRLRPLTYYFQKTMLPVGERQKPILEYILRTLKHNGIDEALLLASYKAEQIQNYFKSGTSLDMDLSYLADDPNMKGNGGALLNAYRKGVLNEDDQILVYYGDILTTMDLKRMLARHISTDACATLAVAHGYRLPVGVAEVKGDRLLKMEEKPSMDIRVGIGILALKGEALMTLEGMSKGAAELDVMGELIPQLISEGKKVKVFETKDYWIDVGSIETYEKLDHAKLERSFRELFLYEVSPQRADL